MIPSVSPSDIPSFRPSASPSNIPSMIPSVVPSSILSVIPSVSPSDVPSASPSVIPSESASDKPSESPSLNPSKALVLWTQLGSDIDGEAAGNESGASVSLSADGETVAIGAYLNDGNGSDSGHVRVYKFVSSAWNQLRSDIEGEAADDNSGVSVSLSGNGETVTIGAYCNDGSAYDSGHVRVYKC
eukprot:CAMPEP_0184860186 /NCGR_PEP_ID=MMETSP0580-20130426/5129_1 /TAXON_ID=1118495 /ORGANISM="Dactyliosolen fragilissimus" /LENGTH=185 /DNA_ID=CAMNT_0027357207 /DNA_START=202 /DNA_END=759 /DNA_ORIENTATION=-